MLIVTVRVTPNAKKQRIQLDQAGSMRIYVTAQPERGKANAELIAVLAKKLGLSKSRISVVKGAASRQKTVAIDTDVTWNDLLQALGLPHQLSM